MDKIDPSLCRGSGNVGHDGEYGRIGFCPCGEFVAHQSDKPCDVIKTTKIKESSLEPKSCQCRAEACPCGDFISHKVFEPCNAKIKQQ